MRFPIGELDGPIRHQSIEVLHEQAFGHNGKLVERTFRETLGVFPVKRSA
jgi:hypothetical protein